MKHTYIVALALIILMGMFLANYLPIRENGSAVLRERTESFVSLLPHGDRYSETRAEVSAPVAMNTSSTVRSAPQLVAPVKEQPTAPALPAFKESAPPATYLIFYTGTPVRHVPTTTVVYVPPTVQTSIVPVVPVVQPQAVPIFVPQVVPSRVGPSKLVYSNGVVIKPRVYFPHQPVRNSIRGVTP
jgi:hypothetical protein